MFSYLPPDHTFSLTSMVIFCGFQTPQLWIFPCSALKYFWTIFIPHIIFQFYGKIMHIFAGCRVLCQETRGYMLGSNFWPLKRVVGPREPEIDHRIFDHLDPQSGPSLTNVSPHPTCYFFQDSILIWGLRNNAYLSNLERIFIKHDIMLGVSLTSLLCRIIRISSKN